MENEYTVRERGVRKSLRAIGKNGWFEGRDKTEFFGLRMAMEQVLRPAVSKIRYNPNNIVSIMKSSAADLKLVFSDAEKFIKKREQDAINEKSKDELLSKALNFSV